MSKRLFCLLAALCCLCSTVRADDVADVRKAFDLYVQYNKIADKRLLDLFAPDVSVTIAGDTGKGKQDLVMPAETFRQMVQESIKAKDGSNETYNDVKYTPENDTVKVTGTCTQSGDKPEPFVFVYAKDVQGKFVIKALKMTVDRPHG